MKELNDVKNALKTLGYDDYHSRIIMALMRSNSYLTAKEIEDQSGVPLARLYSILLDLKKEKLVSLMPGHIRKYKVATDICKRLTERRNKDIEKQKTEVSDASKYLATVMKNIPKSQGVEIELFTDSEEYWNNYNRCASKFKSGDIYRIINTTRLADSILPEEYEDIPGLKKMIFDDQKMQADGVIVHTITNPEALVKNMLKEHDAEFLKRSMKVLLESFREPAIMKNHWITIAPEFNNILIVIMKNVVFFEFYGQKSSVISSALKITGKTVASDLAVWFDGFAKKKHDPKKDYDVFEKEILKACKKLARIEIDIKK
jgi:hypothetical protein